MSRRSSVATPSSQCGSNVLLEGEPFIARTGGGYLIDLACGQRPRGGRSFRLVTQEAHAARNCLQRSRVSCSANLRAGWMAFSAKGSRVRKRFSEAQGIVICSRRQPHSHHSSSRDRQKRCLGV